MREIKFRAWDRDHNKMLTNITEIWRLDHVTNLASQESDHNNLRLGWMDDSRFGYWRDIIPKQVDLMQYTGLKDKNGKEIYEGDIITGKSSASGMPVKASVDFECGSFGIEDFHLHELYDIEIIGNIYENPDLLNSEQNPERSVATEDQSGNKKLETKK